MELLLFSEVQKTIFLSLDFIEIESADPCPVMSVSFSTWSGGWL